jgi:hypothetical protein
MSDFLGIFADVIRLATFQPREPRMRYRRPQWEERIRMEVPERRVADFEPRSIRR